MGKRPEFTRRGALLAAAGIAGTLLCVGCGEVHARLTLGPARPVTVALDGPPSALYAPLYTATANGDFAAGALAVKLAEAPAGDSLTALAQGRATIAISSEPDLLAARARGARLVAVAALLAEPLEGIVSLASRPIAGAAQLAGHTLAVAPSPLVAAELAAVLARAKIAPARVRRIAASGDLASALTAHQAIATLGAPWPLEWAALANSGQPPAPALTLAAAGVPRYSGLVVVVRVGEAHYQGPLLRAFLQSLSRGERAVAADPRAAAATLATVNPQLNAAIERSALSQTLPRARAAGSAKPFGYQYPSDWSAFATWMHQHGLLSAGAVASAGIALTNEFLPGQGA